MKSLSESRKGKRLTRSSSTSGLASEEPRDAQETAGGGFRGPIQAPLPRGSRKERGESSVDFCTLTPFLRGPIQAPLPRGSRKERGESSVDFCTLTPFLLTPFLH
jgi:hypothetical protein